MAKKLTEAQALDIGKEARKLALSFAAKTGTAIDLTVVTNANAKETYKLSPITLRQAILDNMSPEDIAELPQPGSKWNDEGMFGEDGKPNATPDIFLWKDPSAGVDSKPKEVSFYVAWAENTPEGKAVVQEIDYCKRIGKPNMKVDDIPAEWRAKYDTNPQDLQDRLDYLEGRKATIRSAYKEAVRLIWQMDMVNELGPEGEGPQVQATISKIGQQIKVVDLTSDGERWKLYSPSAFLRLNPKVAQEQGGTFAALKLTEKREPKKETPKGGVPALASIQTPETMDVVALPFHSYLDKAMHAKGGPDYTALLRHLTSDAGKMPLLTLGGIRDCLNDLFKMEQINSRYDILREQNKAETKAA